MSSTALTVFNFVTGLIGCGAVGMVVGRQAGKLVLEARSRDKRIELATFAVALMAFLVSAGSLAYTVVQVDALSDRVAALEKAVQSSKPAAEAKPEAKQP